MLEDTEPEAEGGDSGGVRRRRAKQQMTVHAAVFSDGITLSSENRAYVLRAANARLWKFETEKPELYYTMQERVMRDD